MVAPWGVLPVGPVAATIEVVEDVDGKSLGVLSTGPTAATTKVKGDIDSGPPRRCCRWVRQRPPPKLYRTSMVGPLGVLTVGSTAATTEVVGDVDGGLPVGGASRSGSSHHFHRKALMADPLGDAIGRIDSSHHCLAVVVGVNVVDGRAPGRQYRSRERPPPNAVGRRWHNQAPSRDPNSISYPKGH
jgi:hypothetical protein